MSKYYFQFFENGRAVPVPWDLFNEAYDQRKEILIICTGWSGGYARAYGATKGYDEELGEIWECYSYEVRDISYDQEALQKYYKVIITDGIKIYMKTHEPATSYFGHVFSDWDSKFETRLRFLDEEDLTEEQFEKNRHIVDVERTINLACESLMFNKIIPKEDLDIIKEELKSYF